ncbi:MAG: hypothetical protein M3094_01725 [Actinomycetia bacterium]|nr:hypothetical protein [Actinomycetes bacterium]
MRLVRSLSVLLLSLGFVMGGVSFAQTSGDDPVVVIEVGDPLDQRSIDYVTEAINAEQAHVFILKIDSPGVSSGDLAALFDAVTNARAPVVAWVGPSPAVAFGGAAYLVNQSDVRTAAPGAEIGYLRPAVQRGEAEPPSVRADDDPDRLAVVVGELEDAKRTVTPQDPTIYGFVDRLEPALGQLIVSLDGDVVTKGDVSFDLSTARVETIDGQEFLVSSRPVKFIKAGLLDRFLRLGARPETASLFLLFGVAFAAFEFFAAGGGLMAFVSSLSFILAGYGLATLPIWWPALGMIAVALVLLVWGFAQNRTDWRAIVGTVLLLVAGMTFTTTRPQYPPVTWMVLLAVAGSVVFIWYALTTVVRGRFATPTVGREDLYGRRCIAVSDLDPLGVVLVDGARWRATADRGVVLAAGSPVEIVGITGLVLEIDPLAGQGREESS